MCVFEAFSVIVDDASRNFLIFGDSSHQAIQQMDLETSTFMKTPVNGLGNPIAVDVDPKNGHVYWADRKTKRIRRVDVDGRNDITIRQLGGRKYYKCIWKKFSNFFWRWVTPWTNLVLMGPLDYSAVRGMTALLRQFGYTWKCQWTSEIGQ